jgi:hypothetical protein
VQAFNGNGPESKAPNHCEPNGNLGFHDLLLP